MKIEASPADLAKFMQELRDWEDGYESELSNWIHKVIAWKAHWKETLEKCIELSRQQAEWWDDYVEGGTGVPHPNPPFERYYALNEMRKMLVEISQPSGESAVQESPPESPTRIELRPR